MFFLCCLFGPKSLPQSDPILDVLHSTPFNDHVSSPCSLLATCQPDTRRVLSLFGVELFCCEPKHRLAKIVVNGEISIDLHPVNFVLPYDFLDQLITSMRDIRNPAAGLPKIPRPKTPENLLSRENGAGTDVHAGNESGGFRPRQSKRYSSQ